MDMKAIYKQKLCSAEEAVGHIQSGDRVVVGHACGEPVALTDAMVACAKKYDYADVEVVHMVAMGKALYCESQYQHHFRHNALFAGARTKLAIEEGRGDFTPVFFSQVPELLRCSLPVDVALIQVSPPDAHGYCSLGISCDYTKTAAETARVCIAQVNHSMPRVHGNNFIHIEAIDHIVEIDEPLLQLKEPVIGEVQKRIGQHVASLVRDGDCLQLGIGAIPDAVLMFLEDKQDLGIHSEMFSDGVVGLIEKGVITNRCKQIDKGQCVASFLMGTEKLYDYVNDNPSVKMMPVDYVNDPRIICMNDQVVSINSCVEVDLMGQVCSETIGLKQISGVGGQVDFVRGATMSKEGRTIMAMPATAAGGSVSKIVPLLTEGAAVTTSRCDVDYVVTEYGIAQLHGQTLRERARRLIAIAAPEFRTGLAVEFEKRFKCAYETDE